MSKFVCAVDDCGEEIPEGRGSKGGLPICDRCRGSSYYWNKQGAKAVQARRELLTFYDSRLGYLQVHVARLVNDAKNRVARARKVVERRATTH